MVWDKLRRAKLAPDWHCSFIFIAISPEKFSAMLKNSRGVGKVVSVVVVDSTTPLGLLTSF